MCKKKGFTLVELLVVIAIIALLMGILMPALARVRNIAMRMTCGTNLSSLGKAMLIYAGDYDDEFPRGGYSAMNDTLSRNIANWIGRINPSDPPPYGEDPEEGVVSITSCLYLLVKYADVTPKVLVCKSDTGTREFTLAAMKEEITDGTLDGLELVDLWDLGRVFDPDPAALDFGADGYCSYSYQHPVTLYYLTTTSEPGNAVLADRNPWIKSPADDDGVSLSDREIFEDAFAGNDENWEDLKKGNAIAHQNEGQNVLFVDIHVAFEKSPACGLDWDNIYTFFTVDDYGEPEQDIPVGIIPPLETANLSDLDLVGEPGNRRDSYLISNMLGVPSTR